jgi:hypothetical protein
MLANIPDDMILCILDFADTDTIRNFSMTNSKYFIPSCSGHYTLLIKNIVKILGGKVL